jgi:3D (Asp-Asp-Asp) domain-containing protein
MAAPCAELTGNNMKSVVFWIALFQFAVPAAFGRYQSVERSNRAQSLLARVTVYWAKGGSGSDRYTQLHKCATGLRLQDGHCAVDPNQIPYGSQVLFPDGTTLAAVDTGTAVKNRKAARKSGRTAYERNAVVIDRFFETKRQALSWADRNPPFMTVQVVRPNQRALAPSPVQPPPRALAKVASVPNKLKPNSSALFADSSTISRNPFNKLSR